MSTLIRTLTIASAFTLTVELSAAQQRPARGSAVPPPWAYGYAAPPPPSSAPAAPSDTVAVRRAARAARPAPSAPDNTLYTLADSTMSFTRSQITNQFGSADWYPGDHPSMPDIVANGKREQQVTACSQCHYPNGKGRPENAGLAGLPYEYLVQTILDFKNVKRKSSDPRKGTTAAMMAFAQAMTDEEIKAVAAYFSSMKWTPWIRVAETDTVPKTRIANGMYVALEGAEAGREPIGQRIIETPEKTAETELLRNPRSGFVAHVPPGSLRKGEALVRTNQCGACHGADLEGLGPVPGIAGRSPSYTVRQMYDMQRGARTGLWTDLMKPVIEKLSTEDMLNIAAYTASRVPAAVTGPGTRQ